MHRSRRTHKSPAIGQAALEEDDDWDIAGPGELDGPSDRLPASVADPVKMAANKE
jgi:hypothetical protein